MTVARAQTLGTIGIALLGIWSILQAVGHIAFLLPVLFSDDSQFLTWEQLFAPTVHAFLGAGLVMLRRSIAATLFPADSDLDLEVPADFHASLLALLGVWLFVKSVSSASGVESSLVAEFQMYTDSTGQGDRIAYLMSPQAWSHRAPYLVQLTFSVWLVLGASGLASAWRSFRAAGRNR